MTDLDKFITLIKNSKYMTVFTGAGVSTLSHIPDFRGPHGVYTDPWNGMDVEEIISLTFFRKNPEIFYKWAKDVWYHLEDYQPSIVHKCLALLEKEGYLKALYTQNIDMLHQRAGSKNVFDVHGSPLVHHCTKCHASYTYEQIAPIVRSDQVPHCPKCNGVIKPDIIFYEESLNQDVLNHAWHDFSKTDLCVVLGSSLVVQPAASFPVIAKRSGADLVIVNNQPTDLDPYCTVHFDDLETTFSTLYNYFCTEITSV